MIAKEGILKVADFSEDRYRSDRIDRKGKDSQHMGPYPIRFVNDSLCKML